MGIQEVGKTVRRDGLARWTVQGLLALAVAALLAVACDSIAALRCTDPDYPLSCQDNKACCPQGKPFNCGGMCYQTRDQAVAQCGARIDTCYRE
jgi:hypothetical protein